MNHWGKHTTGWFNLTRPDVLLTMERIVKNYPHIVVIVEPIGGYKYNIRIAGEKA